MCGIVAAAARNNIVPVLLEGLRKLEYRGYDSAGLAILNGGLPPPAPMEARSVPDMRKPPGAAGGLP